MPAGSRAYLERLRTQGGPSMDLLVLLDTHRVLTTDQAARATRTPVRSARNRLVRLAEHGLVAAHRPGREVGSSPRHWWLRPAGARLVTGATPVADGRPSHPFVAHAAAIAEVWLAVLEHGPAAGIELTDWRTDRAGWQEWQPPAGLYGDAGRAKRLTPDAVLRAHVSHGDDAGDVAGDAVAMIEIDLATMTQTQLREKLSRYEAYAAAGAWRDTFPHCPPMLLLTTTTARATTYIRGARRALASGRGLAGGREPLPGRWADRWAEPSTDADRLMVAACGLVHDPARAISEPVWLLDTEATGEVTLAELLAERVTTQRAAAAAAAAADRRRVATERRDALDEIRRRQVWDLTRLLDGDQAAGRAAAEALARLAEDPDRLLADEPHLADTVIAWWGPRRGRRPTGPAPPALVDELHERHAQLWAADVGRVLVAHDHLAAGDPRLAAIAAHLQAGRLLGHREHQHLADDPVDRAGLVADELADHIRRRDADVARAHAALGWRTRRRTTLAELAAAYDEQHLLVCTVCAIPAVRDDYHDDYRDDDSRRTRGALPGHRCEQCGAGELADPTDLPAAVPTLTDRLTTLQATLRVRCDAPRRCQRS